MTKATIPSLPSAPTVASATRISPEQEVLLNRVERAVRRQTGDKVRNLRVRLSQGIYELEGRCGTFYCKQLAQHAAMEVLDGRELHNLIEVW